ncbi:MAG: FAD-dependent oxidoreductase [Ruminococcaceae bacterium]|nr:FAD-dependent oxidoreductase [Oscillospiraceae bacterium]
MKDVIIIGGGPAGLTAAIYASRSGKSVLLFEKESYGGQISKSGLVENFPSQKAISGFEFSMNLYNQAKQFGCEFVKENVISVTDGEIKKVITAKNEYECRNVIFALGASPKKSGLPNEASLIGRGLSYCAHCDGNFFRKKDVAVIGGGSTALQDALYLSEICSKVYLIHRRNEFRGEAALVKRVTEKENIEIVYDSTLEAASGEPLLRSITVKNKNSGEEREISVSGLFLAIGQEPGTKGFESILPLDEYGYADVDESCKVKDGIYVCGDCRKKALRQLTTAVSDGSVAGASVE